MTGKTFGGMRRWFSTHTGVYSMLLGYWVADTVSVYSIAKLIKNSTKAFGTERPELRVPRILMLIVHIVPRARR